MIQRYLSFVAVAVAGVFFLIGCEEPVEQKLYRQVAVSQRDIVVTANAAGVVEPIKVVEVKSKASGEIVRVNVEEGDAVRTGDLLVRVDPRLPRNAVVQAEADSAVAAAELEIARSRLRRAEELHESGSITDEVFEDAKLAEASAYATIIRARTALEDARIAFEETEVRAPSDGIILSKSIEEGTVITSASRDIAGGSVLMRMANLDTVQVRAFVTEADVGKIRPGMSVTIQVDAFRNRTFEGDVLRIGAEAIVEQNVTMFPALMRIENPGLLLRPGMNAEVEIHVGSVENALAIPTAALTSPQDLNVVAPMVGLTPEQVQEQLSQSDQSERKDATPDSADTADGQMAKRPSEGNSERPRGNWSGQHSGRRPMGGRPGGGRRGPDGSYVVVAVRNGQPTATRIRTGLTDFSYIAVLDGLNPDDSVLILPTAGLVQSQQRFQDWAQRRAGGTFQTGR
ncbi:MAG: efflux RND transporter periplasmic adaptor subunit [candidate division Zixibacteria bacterium]|nr:efflux RND transporter periplasmic adaptor subunit [candidate division Zixibacteria bacterium]